MIRSFSVLCTLFLFACGGGTKSTDSAATGNPCADPCGGDPCANPCGDPCAGDPCAGGGGAETGIDWASWKTWTKVSSETFKSKHPQKPWVDVYVTTAHADAYKAMAGGFPQGMGVVKVQYLDDGGKPGAMKNITVMAKMAPGYDAEHGDWYYAAMSPDASTTMVEGKVESCINCHDSADTDYLFGVPK